MLLGGQGRAGCWRKSVPMLEDNCRSFWSGMTLGFGTKAKYSVVMKQAYNAPSSHAISLQAAV